MYTAAFKPYKSRISLRSRYFEQAENSVLVIHWEYITPNHELLETFIASGVW